MACFVRGTDVELDEAPVYGRGVISCVEINYTYERTF